MSIKNSKSTWGHGGSTRDSVNVCYYVIILPRTLAPPSRLHQDQDPLVLVALNMYQPMQVPMHRSQPWCPPEPVGGPLAPNDIALAEYLIDLDNDFRTRPHG